MLPLLQKTGKKPAAVSNTGRAAMGVDRVGDSKRILPHYLDVNPWNFLWKEILVLEAPGKA